MKPILVSLCFNFWVTALFSQDTKKIVLSFESLFAETVIHTPTPYFKLNATDSIQIETLKFYTSGIALLNKGKVVWQEQNSFHLLDMVSAASTRIALKVPVEILYDELKFNLGIDSITNVSGAMGGDLDPTKGMYWTWQNGYINFKLEGKSSVCKTRNNEFQFHLGGYQYPFKSMQTVKINVSQRDKLILLFDVNKLLSTCNLVNQNQIMSPCVEAVLISIQVANAFRVKQ